VTRSRLDELALSHPDWRPWLSILRPTCEAIDDPSWGARLGSLPTPAEPDVPRLAGAQLAVDERIVRDWVTRLVGAAAGTVARAGREVALDVLQVSLDADSERAGDLARGLGVGAVSRVGAVIPLAAIPLLHAARRAAAGSSRSTGAGSCPTCGAWPTLAELRGLERTRHLRCARCGDGWEIEWLRCPFCDEREHARLGWLAPETTRETRRVETCASCRGYVKTVAKLTATSPADLLVEDLLTVDLDVAALRAGYARPAGPGRRLGARVTDTRERGGIFAWR
jgi:FdhE protein